MSEYETELSVFKTFGLKRCAKGTKKPPSELCRPPKRAFWVERMGGIEHPFLPLVVNPLADPSAGFAAGIYFFLPNVKNFPILS